MVKRRDKKIRQLISEVNTLQRALDESTLYIDDRLADIPVEDIIKYFKNRRSGKIEEVENHFERSQQFLKEKWGCYECGDGYLRLVIIRRPDGQHYFRSCTVCTNKTGLKKYTEEVEGPK